MPIQDVEGMLQSCAIDFVGKWDGHLSVEIAYNTNYTQILIRQDINT